MSRKKSGPKLEDAIMETHANTHVQDGFMFRTFSAPQGSRTGSESARTQRIVVPERRQSDGEG